MKKYLYYSCFVLMMVLSNTGLAQQALTDFVTVWDTTKVTTGGNGNTIVEIPINCPNSSPTCTYTYNYDVDWDNDGVFDDTGVTGNISHDYGIPGEYTVRIRGTFPHFYFRVASQDGTDPGYLDKEKLMKVTQWGDVGMRNAFRMFDGAINLTITAIDKPNLSSVQNLSFMFRNAISANPDTSEWVTVNITNMAGMFAGATSATPTTTTDLGNGYWDTSGVTQMQSMFDGATSANPDVSGWDTSSVKNMMAMFRDAESATLRVSNPLGDTINWNTSIVENMRLMFRNAINAEPEVGAWDTANVKDMSAMFHNAEKATPDTSSWDTSNVRDMSYMFSGALLANPDTSMWETHLVEDMDEMFKGAVMATPTTVTGGPDGLNPNIWNTSRVGTQLVNPDTLGDPDTEPREDGDGGMRSMFQNAERANPITSGWNTAEVKDMSYMFAGATDADPNVEFWDVGEVTNMRGMFMGFVEPVEGVPADTDMIADPEVGLWNIENVRDISFMFRFNPTANPDVSDWNTENVIRMNHLFDYAFGAVDADVSGFKTSEVLYMQAMFRRAPINPITITDLNTGVWDTSKVIDMSSMFATNTVANPDTSGWNTVSVEHMAYMFAGATSATFRVGDPVNGDTANWNTAQVVSMQGLFRNASVAKPNTAGWNTSSAVNMRHMFQNAYVAEPVTSSWNTSSVTNMSEMFNNAYLANPDVSGWNTASVTTMLKMFANADSATLRVGNPLDGDTFNWVTSEVADMSRMFEHADNAQPATQNWNVSKVEDFSYMFKDAVSVTDDQVDVSAWDVSSAKFMDGMFEGTPLNIDMSNWQIPNLTVLLDDQNEIIAHTMRDFYSGAQMSTSNYDVALLNFREGQINGVPQDVILDAGSSKYCDAEVARNELIGIDGWTITDGGKDCTPDAPLTGPDLIDVSDSGYLTTDNRDNYTNVTLPSFTVQCSEGGNTITLSLVGTAQSQTYLCPDAGALEVAWPNPLTPVTSPTTYSFSYTETKQGFESLASPVLDIYVDIEMPTFAPEITDPIDGSVINDATPIVSGSVAGVQDADVYYVEVLNGNGDVVCISEVITNVFACQVSAGTPLTEGVNELKAIVYDLAGNPSTEGSSIFITLNSSASYEVQIDTGDGLVTTEEGGQDSFTVTLGLTPSHNVTINFLSNDLTEGTISPSSLTFTPQNATEPQQIVLTGVMDEFIDGDITYYIQIDAVNSMDLNYDGMVINDIEAINIDSQVTPDVGIFLTNCVKGVGPEDRLAYQLEVFNNNVMDIDDAFVMINYFNVDPNTITWTCNALGSASCELSNGVSASLGHVDIPADGTSSIIYSIELDPIGEELDIIGVEAQVSYPLDDLQENNIASDADVIYQFIFKDSFECVAPTSLEQAFDFLNNLMMLNK